MGDTFASLINILPDPNNSIADDGGGDSDNTGYTAGPGFKSI